MFPALVGIGCEIGTTWVTKRRDSDEASATEKVAPVVMVRFVELPRGEPVCFDCYHAAVEDGDASGHVGSRSSVLDVDA